MPAKKIKISTKKGFDRGTSVSRHIHAMDLPINTDFTFKNELEFQEILPQFKNAIESIIPILNGYLDRDNFYNSLMNKENICFTYNSHHNAALRVALLTLWLAEKEGKQFALKWAKKERALIEAMPHDDLDIPIPEGFVVREVIHCYPFSQLDLAIKYIEEQYD